MDTPNNNFGSASDTGMTTGSGSSSMGAGMGASTGSGFGATNTGAASGTQACAHCGQAIGDSARGLEQFLGKVGISDDMINNLKSQFQNVDVDQYLNTAREYLKGGSGKATSYAKENPGKIAAGVAILAVGAGLLISAMSKE